jgi:hypothetical protein
MICKSIKFIYKENILIYESANSSDWFLQCALYRVGKGE